MFPSIKIVPEDEQGVILEFRVLLVQQCEEKKNNILIYVFVKYFEQVRRETAVVEAKRYEISLESAPQAIIQIYFALTTGILTTTMMIGK